MDKIGGASRFMNKRIFFLVLISIMSLYLSSYAQVEKPQIISGFIDLNGFDFSKGETLKLEGEWEGVKNKLLTPDEIRNNDNRIKVVDSDGFKFGEVATYILTLKSSYIEDLLSVKVMGRGDTFFKIWINGELKGQINEYDKLDQKKPWDDFKLQKIYPFRLNEGENEVVIQLASSMTERFDSVCLGNYDHFITQANSRNLRDYILVTIALVLGFYHILYAIPQSNKNIISRKLFLVFGIYLVFNSIQVLQIYNRTEGHNYLWFMNLSEINSYLAYFLYITPRIIYTFFIFPIYYYIYHGKISKKTLVSINSVVLLLNLISVFAVIPRLSFLYEVGLLLNVLSLLLLITVGAIIPIVMLINGYEKKISAIILFNNVFVLLIPFHDILIRLEIFDGERKALFQVVGTSIVLTCIVAMKTKSLYAKNEKYSVRIASIVSLTQDISSILEQSLLFNKIADISMNIVSAKNVVIATVDDKTNQLQIVASRINTLNEVTFEKSVFGIMRKTIAIGMHTILSNKEENNGDMQNLFIKDIETILCFPIKYNNKVRGAFYIEADKNIRDIESEDIEMLNSVLTQLSISLENAELYSRLESLVEERTEQLNKTNNELNKTIEKLQSTQNQLVQSEKIGALGRLVTGISHQLNTPIGICFSAVSHLNVMADSLGELIKEENAGKSELNEYVINNKEGCEMILSNLRKLNELLKLFKEISTEEYEEEKKLINIKELIEFEVIELRIKDAGHEVNIECDENLEIETYSIAFVQLIKMLIKNSVVHGFEDKEHGKIDIKAKKESGEILLTFRDNGKGIDERHIKRIFEPFYTATRKEGSIGLGLNISYNIVTTILKGTINCESTIGQGVTIIIKFPAE